MGLGGVNVIIGGPLTVMVWVMVSLTHCGPGTLGLSELISLIV